MVNPATGIQKIICGNSASLPFDSRPVTGRRPEELIHIKKPAILAGGYVMFLLKIKARYRTSVLTDIIYVIPDITARLFQGAVIISVPLLPDSIIKLTSYDIQTAVR